MSHELVLLLEFRIGLALKASSDVNSFIFKKMSKTIRALIDLGNPSKALRSWNLATARLSYFDRANTFVDIMGAVDANGAGRNVRPHEEAKAKSFWIRVTEYVQKYSLPSNEANWEDTNTERSFFGDYYEQSAPLRYALVECKTKLPRESLMIRSISTYSSAIASDIMETDPIGSTLSIESSIRRTGTDGNPIEVISRGVSETITTGEAFNPDEPLYNGFKSQISMFSTMFEDRLMVPSNSIKGWQVDVKTIKQHLKLRGTEVEASGSSRTSPQAKMKAHIIKTYESHEIVKNKLSQVKKALDDLEKSNGSIDASITEMLEEATEVMEEQDAADIEMKKSTSPAKKRRKKNQKKYENEDDNNDNGKKKKKDDEGCQH